MGLTGGQGGAQCEGVWLREGLGSVPKGRGGGRTMAEVWLSEDGRAREMLGPCHPLSLPLVSH